MVSTVTPARRASWPIFMVTNALDPGPSSRPYGERYRDGPATANAKGGNMSEGALTCDLSMMTAEQRARLLALAHEIFDSATELRVLADGFGLWFADASPSIILKLAE